MPRTRSGGSWLALCVVVGLASAVAAADPPPEVAPLLMRFQMMRQRPKRYSGQLAELAKQANADYEHDAAWTKAGRGGWTPLDWLPDIANDLAQRENGEPLAWDADLAAAAAGVLAGKPSPAAVKLTVRTAGVSWDAALLGLLLSDQPEAISTLLDPATTRVGVARQMANGQMAFVIVADGPAGPAAHPVAPPGNPKPVVPPAGGGKPFDARTDTSPPAMQTSVYCKEPTITPVVEADGGLAVAWRDFGPQTRIMVTRYGPDGAKKSTVEVGAADRAHYTLLAGFAGDAQGNLYVLRAVDEGNLDDKPEPATPKGTSPANYDRPEQLKLTKLDGGSRELWTKELRKDRGSAQATFSALSSWGKGTYASTGKLATITVRQPIYKLAADPTVLVPTSIAEQCLLGFTSDQQGQRGESRFAPAFQPTVAADLLTPKASLMVTKELVDGYTPYPVPPDNEKLAAFWDDGTPKAFSGGKPGGASFDPATYAKFVAFAQANQEDWFDAYKKVPAAKLKLTASSEEVTLVMALYGCATDYDAGIGSRHQQAWWRVVRADNGEPVTGLNGWAMGHSFDMRLLPSDEGIISVERNDVGVVAANYLRYGYERNHRAYVLEHAHNGNDSFCELGMLAGADDGYLLLATSNRSPLETKDLSGDNATIDAELKRSKDLAIVRIRRGFVDVLDKVGKFPWIYRNKPTDAMPVAVPASIYAKRTTYLTNYAADGTFDASRARLVRLDANLYTVIWERWTRKYVDYGNGFRTMEGAYDSTLAMNIDADGKVLKPAVKLAGDARITRGEDAFLWQGASAWITGEDGSLVLHTVSADLTHDTKKLPL